MMININSKGFLWREAKVIDLAYSANRMGGFFNGKI
jgi:hypothetical protein